MSCLEDLNNFYDFYAFYDFYGFNDLPLTAHCLLLTTASHIAHLGSIDISRENL